jgi:arylsulfatase A-like enzyme
VQITGYVNDIITDLLIDWLDHKRDTNKPFLCMYLHKAPHRSWWPNAQKFEEFSKHHYPEPNSLFDDYQNRGVAAKTAKMNILKHMMISYDCKVLPKAIEELNLNSDPRNKPYFEYSSISRMNSEQKALYLPILDSIAEEFKTKWPSMNEKEKMQWKYQRYIQDYLACISSVDDNVGRVLNYLDEKGLSENTIVVYTSDQGFYLGEHGWFDKRFMYNESFKTPLLIRWPNTIKAGITNDEMVQNLDFAQTFLEAAGIAIPHDMQGESMMPLLKGNEEKWNRNVVYYHYYEFPNEHEVYPHYGIATKDYKLFHFYGDIDEWELYDLKKDPNEMRNEYNNPKYQERVKNLKIQLTELRIIYGDTIRIN